MIPLTIPMIPVKSHYKFAQIYRGFSIANPPATSHSHQSLQVATRPILVCVSSRALTFRCSRPHKKTWREHPARSGPLFNR